MRLTRWAVLWTALIVLICAPALAQGAEDEGRDGNVTIVDCSQVQNVFVQGQYGDANASAQYDSDAIAIVAQELDISQDQVNFCLVNVGDGGGNDDGDDDTTTDDTTTDDTTTDDTTTDDTTTDDTTTGAADTDDKGDVIADTIPETDELPETGGPGGIGMAVVCALLGVGLIVSRIVR